MLNDEALLVDIRDKDLVAIEVRYHRSCYKNYTNFLSQADNEVESQSLIASHKKAFDKFCLTIIEERIIRKQELLRLTTLHDLFRKTISEVENLEESIVRTSYLKEKLKRRYPSLQFLRPSKQTTSEIVFSKESSTVFADKWDSTSASETEDSELDTDNETANVQTSSSENNDKHLLYMSSQMLKGVISSVPGLNSFWPPTANDIRENSAEKLIPPNLFNFLAWIAGVSDELEFDNFVETSNDIKTKILSIAQDLVHLSTKGRRMMPKHVALGLTM